MKNILLVCSAGMSTGMIVKKMEAVAAEEGIEAKIWAVGDSVSAEHIPNADVVLVGPQVRFLVKKLQEMAGNKPVKAIDMADYGKMDGKKILHMAIDLIDTN